MTDLPTVIHTLRAEIGEGVDAVAYQCAGTWSKCFTFRLHGVELVARFGPHVVDFAKDRRAAGFAAHGVPVPGFAALFETEDGWCAITERVWGAEIENVNRRGWELIERPLLDAIAAMWTIDLSTATGFGHWDAAGNAPMLTWSSVLLAVAEDRPEARIHGWRHKIGQSPVGLETLRTALAELRPIAGACPHDERSVVHADLLHGNALVVEDRINGIFDWGASMYGDPVFEPAWVSFWAPWHPGIDGPGFVDRWRVRAMSAERDLSAFDERLRACHLSIGVEHLAYNAYRGRWDVLERVAARIRDAIDG